MTACARVVAGSTARCLGPAGPPARLRTVCTDGHVQKRLDLVSHRSKSHAFEATAQQQASARLLA